MVKSSPKIKRNHMAERPHEEGNPGQKRLFTLKEAAHYFGKSEWGMRELIWAGEIPVVRQKGGRKIFLDIQDLDDFINRNKSIYI